MRHWRLAIAILVGVLTASPASAAPVFYAEDQPAGLADIPVELTGLGSTISVDGQNIVVGGEMGFAEISATVLDAETFEPIGTVSATTSIAVGDGRLATVSVESADADSGSHVLKVYETNNGEVLELASTSIAASKDFDRLGTEIAIGTNFVAVVEGGQGPEPDEVRVFAISDDAAPTLTEVRTIASGLSNTHISISGSSLVLSGVPPLGNVGHLVIYDLDDGSELDRLNNVGGGPVVMSDGVLYVQRNQFFVQPDGTWTMVEFSGDSLGDSHGLPGSGSSLAASEDLVLIGDSIRNQVLVLEATPDQDWPFRFTQAIRNPQKRSADQFGAAVALIDGQALVGVPAVSTGDLVLRGAVMAYQVDDGPIGCTIVGTPGDDEKLTGTILRDTMCGLGGNDRILGFAGDDIIHGGPGDDAILGNAGDDILFGNEGDDILNGGDDDDLLVGAEGDDTGNGGAGDDTFVGGPGRDKGNGGEGNNTCDAEQRFLC